MIMMRRRIWLSFLVSLLLTGSLGFGAGGESTGEIPGRTWHVSQEELPGLPAEAQFRTIAEAAAQVAAGDMVVIHGGTYREYVLVEASGTAERPIRFVAADGERVVVTGADRITDWERVDTENHICRTPWPYRFILWNEANTHPDDERHLVIGRSEQVIVYDYLLHQILSREQMSRGTFYVDLDAKQLYAWGYGDEPFDEDLRVEASTREIIWDSKGDYVHVRGIRFRYAANRAQQGAVRLLGDHTVVEDCIFERTNGNGLTLGGEDMVIRRCTIQDNGQLGFGAARAHNLLVTGCTVRNNNTKGFDRGWEAGANKIVFSRGAVFENSTFVENRGHGIWFDIGNEDCEVRNCLIADNEDGGIFYEIAYGLHVHENVIVGNGFADSDGSWGASCGVSLSSSPGCVIERNLIVGNKEGFNFREQGRTTPRIEDSHREEEDRREHPIWTHDETIRNNVLAYNRDAQVWGWFDIGDQRHWPAAMQVPAEIEREGQGQPAGLSLEKLNLTFQNNVYFAAPNQGLFTWGTAWDEMHRSYASLDEVRADLKLDSGSVVAEPDFADMTSRDFRVPADSPIITKGCYPQGEVPGVKLGVERPSSQ